jgi:hypothetical protein
MAMASSDSTSGGDGERDVFGSLPNSRPQRRSARRDPSRATEKPRAAKPPARAKPAPRAKAAAKPRAAAPPRPATPPKPTASTIPPAGYATPRADDDDGVPHGARLVTTAVQAAGELAQIGLAAGGRAVKSALGRLPRP